MPQSPLEIHPGKFSLNVSGVAGFFGGDEAIAATQTIHHHKTRKFLGWYNSPGSWNVGKKFGKLAKSDLWDGLFPGPDEEPAKFFELDGKQGPKYVASRSGTILEHTGHLAYLIMQESKGELGDEVEDGRFTKRNKITIIKTQTVFKPEDKKEMPEETPKYAKGPKPRKEEKTPPARDILPRSGIPTLYAVLPIAVSFTTCALCGWAHDWFCFSMILLGIVSSGIFSVVMGSARLKLQGVNSAPTAPPGDGMLMDGDDIVLLLGKEEDIATITRGSFVLEYDPWVKSRSKNKTPSVLEDGMKPSGSDSNSDAEKGQSSYFPKQDATPQTEVAAPQTEVAAPTERGATSPKPGDEPESEGSLRPGKEPIIDEYNAIGLCSLLLVIQLLAQLLLIPQGTLSGQIMFLISFAASWAYNLYLSSINNEDIQKQLILKELHLEKQHMRTYIFLTRTSAAVFACLMLQPVDVNGKYIAADKWECLGFKPDVIIHNFIPNDTQVWDTWRKKILEVMKTRDGSEDTCDGLLQMSSEDETNFEEGGQKLLKLLLEDARIAYRLVMKENLKGWLEEK